MVYLPVHGSTEAVERALAENGDVEAQPGSALEQIADLVGVGPDSDAPTDLSTTPEHMEDTEKSETSIDAGPLVAYLRRRDEHHGWASK